MGDKDNFVNISCGIQQEIQQKKQLFLFRFPKDFNVKQLEKMSVTLPLKEQSLTMKIGDGEYRIRQDEELLHRTIRPLISTNESLVTVGNPFAASFTLSRNITLKSQDDSPPITFYSKVPQVAGLTVRHMPFGSTTALEDLRSRASQSPKLIVRDSESSEVVVAKEKHKKRKSEIKESIDTEGVETPSKPKKSKKNKKSRESKD